MAPSGRARKEEAGHVGARGEQQHRDRADEHPHPKPRRPENVVYQRRQPSFDAPPARGGARRLIDHAIEVRAGRRERGLRLQPPNGEEDSDLAVLELVEHGVRGDRRQIGDDGCPRFRAGRIAKIGWHNADDGERTLG